jgi:hypothetical protein
LERARAERVATDEAAADKGKGRRGHKRDVSAEEADSSIEGEAEGDIKAQKAGSSGPALKGKKKAARRSRVQQPQPQPEPELEPKLES